MTSLDNSLSLLAAVAVVACASGCVDRRSDAYVCDSNADCTLPRFCQYGWCVLEAGKGEGHLEMSKDTYAVNEQITVRFRDLPAGDDHWIGTFAPGSANDDDIEWKYTDGSPDGSVTLPGMSAGDYRARLFLNDSYELEDEVPFTVE